MQLQCKGIGFHRTGNGWRLFFLSAQIVIRQEKNIGKKIIPAPGHQSILLATVVPSRIGATMKDEMSDRLRLEVAKYLSARKAHCAEKHHAASIARVLCVSDLAEIGTEISAERLPDLRNRIVHALRRERGRAKSGSPAYSFNRHIALHQVLKALLGADNNTVSRGEGLARQV
jgi:hypothetical protein